MMSRGDADFANDGEDVRFSGHEGECPLSWIISTLLHYYDTQELRIVYASPNCLATSFAKSPIVSNFHSNATLPLASRSS